jgi:hypothetical protein
MRDFLKEYTEHGWKIFPLLERGKTPISSEFTFKTATSDAELVTEMWERWPKANVGIAPKASGLIILDIDGKNGGFTSLDKIEREHGTITTRRVITGSGGYHYYFHLAPREDIKGRLGVHPGVDIIYHVNHVVAPPSVHPTGTLYRWDNIHVDIEPAPQWLLDLSRLAPTPVIAAAIKPNIIHQQLFEAGRRGRLSALTVDFIENGAIKGTWNTRLFRAAKDYQEQGYTREDIAADMLQKCAPNGLDNSDVKTIDSAYRTEPKYAPRMDANLALRQLILGSHLLKSLADPTKQIFVDMNTGKAHASVNPEVLPKVLEKKDYLNYLTNCVLWAEFKYNPRQNSPLQLNTETGFYTYNTFLPPVWKSDNFYTGIPIQTETEMPEIYEEFLYHLCDGHEPSIDYLLDWVTTSLNGRNWTLLTAIGEEGIGKGTLGQILQLLHGEHNYIKVRDTVFKEKFNAALINRTLVHVDEIDLKTKESIDRIKDVVNETIEIEQKGVDSFVIHNHASFYLNSNSLDAIKLGPGDRRYSIIELTNKKLTQAPDIKVAPLIDPENIAKFASYLINRQTKNNMMIPFKGSRRYDEVKEAGLTEWESWVIDSWAPLNKGEKLPLAELQEKITISLSLKYPPGRMKIMELSKKYDRALKITKDGAVRMVEVL